MCYEDSYSETLNTSVELGDYFSNAVGRGGQPQLINTRVKQAHSFLLYTLIRDVTMGAIIQVRGDK